MIERLIFSRPMIWLMADKRRFAFAASCIAGVLGGLTLAAVLAAAGFPSDFVLVAFVAGVPVSGLMNWQGMASLGFFEKKQD